MIPETMSELSLTSQDGMTQVWFAGRDGRLTGGAAAVNEALKYVWWAWPFAYLYQVPGVKQIQDWVYRWVANNRYRLPGSTAHCSIDKK